MLTTSEYPEGEDFKIPQPRLLLDVIAAHVRLNPQKIWGALPRGTLDASKGYEDITFARLNYAINRAANWMKSALADHKSRKFEPLAYMGPPDARYVIFVLASIKAGFQMLFLSTRNSDEAQYTVLKQADCRKFLCARSMRQRVEALIDNWPSDTAKEATGRKRKSSLTGISDVIIFTVPEQDELLLDVPCSDCPYNKTMEEARRDPLVILHTSSTTGMPKTIPLNQGYGLHEDIIQHIPKVNGLDVITRKPFYGTCRMFVAMPLFHAGGVLLTLLKALYHDIISVFQPPAAQLSATVFDSIIRYGSCNGCVIPPSLLEEMLAVPAYFDTLVNLDFVQFGSGPLSKISGDTLLTRQRNCPHYIGSSECGLFPMLELDDPVKDWQYFHFHPWSGIEMRPMDSDEINYEMFVVRVNKDIPGLQPVFELFPDIKEWPTRDMYVRHPTKNYLWRCIGRADDVMVLSNGEKINPIDMEGHIANTIPSIVGALVVGQGRFLPGLLLETKGVDASDPVQREKLINEIWPYVERANKQAPKHGQLTKSLILFTSMNKPFARTPKLSIRRGPTIQMYAEEIAAMYDRLDTDMEATSDLELPVEVDLRSLESIRAMVLQFIQQLTGWKSLPDLDDDFFIMGMDSLHVARMTRVLKLVLKRGVNLGAGTDMTTRVVYNNPTVNSLAKSILQLASTAPGSSQYADNSTASQIEAMVENYSDFGFHESKSHQSKVNSIRTRSQQSKLFTIVLTGSTGSLGTYLLATFLRNPLVYKIFCLNRSHDARKRQLKSLKALDLTLTTSKLDSKVQFLHTKSLGLPLLGLSNESIYRSLLRSSPTHILHNAWPVNFNLNLSSFEPHIAGVQALIKFCAGIGPEKTKLCFVSSLSSVMALSMRMPVPEQIILDANAPSPMGYGESKYVAERILNAATVVSKGSFSCIILRIGQIAGPIGWLDQQENHNQREMWPKREWLPSLIISSQSIQAIPETLGRMERIEWIPVDVLAGVISELINVTEPQMKERIFENDDPARPTVYNLLNPKQISWKADLLPTIKADLNINQTLSLSQWIRKVRNGPEETDPLKPNPARKILGFYENLANQAVYVEDIKAKSDLEKAFQSHVAETSNAMRKSKIFRELGPVKVTWMQRWMKQWEKK